MDYSSEDEFDNYMNARLNERRPMIAKKITRDFQNPFEYYNEDEFRKRYRFTKEVVLSIILPLVSEDLVKLTKRGLPILPIYQLLVALRFYASGSFQIITGDLVKISQPTLSRIVKKVSRLLCLKVHRFIKFPNNLETIKEQFYRIAHFPGVVGVVDGTHIPIQNPGGEYAEVFRNYILYNIVAERPGSVHDNRIFQNSVLKRHMEQGTIVGLLLGDSGYGCEKYLLTPVPHPETTSEQNYKKAHTTTRNTVERTIGVWIRIFPCLTKKMALNLTTTCHTIVATAVLYNICKARGVIDDVEETISAQQRTSRRNVQNNREGLLFRRMFIDTHF